MVQLSNQIANDQKRRKLILTRIIKNLKILRRSRDDEPIKSEETSGIEPIKSKETRMPAYTTNPFPTSIATFQLVDHH